MKPSRLVALASLVLGLAACGKPAAPPAPPATPAQNPGPPLIPNPMPPSYIGRWAVSADQCQIAAWNFTDKGLGAPGPITCGFVQVTPNETGWIAEGACAAPKIPSAPASLVLNTTRAGADRTLAVSGGPFKAAPVLVACPPATQSAVATTAPGAVNPGPPTGRVDEAAQVDRLVGVQGGVTGSGVRFRRFKDGVLEIHAWSDKAQVVRIGEPMMSPAGRKAGERLYYYRPSETDPFLVREGEVAYALDKGVLIAVFNPQGKALLTPAGADKAALEQRLAARGRDLRKAADG